MAKQITPGEAYKMFKSDPEHVFIVDIRTRAEYIFVGHPSMAYSIPYLFWTPNKDEEAGYKKNPHFVSDFTEKFKKTDKILVMCRSGNRSIPACKILEEAGFTNIFEIPDGFEGRKISDKNSIYYDYCCVNGWRHDGLPWTYEIKGDLAYNKSV